MGFCCLSGLTIIFYFFVKKIILHSQLKKVTLALNWSPEVRQEAWDKGHALMTSSVYRSSLLFSLFVKDDICSRHSFKKSDKSDSLSLLFTKRATRVIRSFKRVNCSFTFKKQGIRTQKTKSEFSTLFFAKLYLNPF